MKRNLLLAGLVLLATVACKKEEEGGDGQGGGSSSNLTTATITLTDSQNWKEGAAVGVYTSDDFNVQFSLNEGAGTTTGVFKGDITKETSMLGAYIPYDAQAGDDLTAVPVNIPTTVVQGPDMELVRFQAAGSDLKFYDKLSTLKVSFSNVEGGTYDGKSISAITLKSARMIAGRFSANLTQPGTTAIAETYEASGTVELAFPSGTTFNKDLVGYASIAPYIKAGTAIEVSLLIEGKLLSAELQASEPSLEGEEYELVIDAGLFEPKIELVWAYGGLGKLEQFSAVYPAIDNNGNVYTTNANSKVLTKINSDGTLGWQKEIGYTTGGQEASPAIEPDGSVIYVAGGKRNSGVSDACLTAFNADGTVKWTFKDWWNKGSDPAVDMNQVTPAIGTDNIYMGNGGTTGTMVAIDKETGKRVSFVANAAVDGGPAGGVGSGMGVSKNGFVTWHCSYGTFAAKTSALDAPTQHETYGGYAPWEHRYGHTWTWNKTNSSVACLSVNGVDHVAAVGVERAGSEGSYKYKMHIVVAPLSGAAEDAKCPGNQTTWTSKAVVEGKCQDQGGIIVGPQNEVIVSLKNGANTGDNDDKTVTYEGGLYAVNPADGSLSWKFNTGFDVCGAAAVDNNGNVHVASDDGYYWILKPDYANKTATVIAKVNIYDLAKNSGKIDLGTATKARIWSSVMIGNDGKMYVGATFHNNWSDRYGVVLCMQYATCSGPGNTAWPMKGADAAHTGCQK